jgi:serine protease Do
MLLIRSNRYIFSLLLVTCFGLLLIQPTWASDLTEYRELETKTQETCQRVQSAVVGLVCTAKVQNQDAMGVGTGVIVSEDGLILTAAHVFHAKDAEVTVVFADGSSVQGVGLGLNEIHDAGMVQILEPGPYPFVELHRDDEIKPGDWCLAVGHTGGVHQGRTAPVRLGRLLTVNDGSPLQGLGLVTDATVNHGDSGGPLFNLDGELIGITSSIGTDLLQNRHVPINTYIDNWDSLLAGETVTQATHQANVAKLQRMIRERAARGDKEAVEMMQGGSVTMSPPQIAELIERWETEDIANGFAVEDDPSRLNTFESMLIDRADQGDSEAIGLLKGAEYGLTADEQSALIKKWREELADQEEESATEESTEEPTEESEEGTVEEPVAEPVEEASEEPVQDEEDPEETPQESPSEEPIQDATEETTPPKPASFEKLNDGKFSRAITGYRKSPNDRMTFSGKSQRVYTQQFRHAPPQPTAPQSSLSHADMEEFREKFQERLSRQDPEVMEMVRKSGGNLTMTPDRTYELLRKWRDEDAGVASDESESQDSGTSDEEDTEDETATAGPAEIAKFKELLRERVLAGDQDARDMIESGKLTITPEKMLELLGQWEAEKTLEAQRALTEEELDAMSREELLERLRELGQVKENGTLAVNVTPDNAAQLMPILRRLGLVDPDAQDNIFGDPTLAKSHPSLLTDFEEITNPLADSIVAVLDDEEPVSYGTIVRADGYILTKNSELPESPTCKIGDRTLTATIAARDEELDLALLKVDATDLTPLSWTEETSLGLGSWLVTPTPEGDPLTLGVLGVASRPIPESPTILLYWNRAVIGVTLDSEATEAKVESMVEGGPAETAGILTGDVILSVNDEPTPTRPELIQKIKGYEAGEVLKIKVRRGNETDGFEELDLEMTLVQAEAQEADAERGQSGIDLEAVNRRAGVVVNERRTGFPAAFSHDSTLQANQCGGPILDLNGNAVGLNIARCGRTSSYAIPADVLTQQIEKLFEAIP